MSEPKKKRPSGRGKIIPESQRHTTRLQLRVPPDVAEEIRSFADATKSSVSDLVRMAWAYASREPGFQDLIAVAVKVANKE